MVRTVKRAIPLCVVISLLYANGALASTSEQPLVNMLFFETDLREALSEISMQTGVNIMPDQTVSGAVTADLQDVPLEQALKILLFGGGYSFRKVDDNLYFVGLPDPRNTSFGQLVESEVILLDNVTVAQVMAVLPNFLTNYVKGEPDSRVLSISAPATEMERIKILIERIDQPRKQVEISVLITEISSSALKDFGVGGAGTNVSYDFHEGQVWNKDWGGNLGLAGQLLSFAFDGYGNLESALKFLEQENEAKVHADPKIVVADGQPAELFIGEEQILLVAAESTTAPTTARVERVEVGVSIRVTPTVVGDQVFLNIAPELSHFINPAASDLVVKQATLSTTVCLASGQTAVLGGMTMQETSDRQSKVPILGDIPIIRWLFRNEASQKTDRELLIFVTPVIL
ncbi:MAG: secretin [Bacillota bacterium]|nr:secretin [Bacillota bacterium]HOB91837.1 secretin [Bacillota bacterium]HPZ55034.1 secretin [Bacillota bacterium]HQD18998.1 secretin [Bacillota bacterium]